MNKAFYLVLTLGLQSCFLFDRPPQPTPEEDPLPTFVSEPDRFTIPNGVIPEASGLVASSTIQDGLWVIEDGNRPSALHLLSSRGEIQGNINLPFANRDWEDIARGNDPQSGESYLYVGETGDNAEVYEDYAIYRFKEPTSLNETITNVETIRFTYGDGLSHDTEAVMVDTTGDIYLITKREINVNVFRITYPYNLSGMNTADLVGKIGFTLITAGDISADGKEIMLRNYDALYYWRRKENETIYEVLSRTRDVSPAYQREPQGEAIAISSDENGFYTISEKPDGWPSPISLNYHGKKESD